MRNIDSALAELKSILKTNGVLLVGYPVETDLFKMIVRVTSPPDFKYIDQSQLFLGILEHKRWLIIGRIPPLINKLIFQLGQVLTDISS